MILGPRLERLKVCGVTAADLGPSGVRGVATVSLVFCHLRHLPPSQTSPGSAAVVTFSLSARK